MGGLRAEAREARDLAIAANNSWLVCYDNLSNLPPWLSDALCRLATGGGFATRELYSNDEEIIFDAMRPLMMNGIEELATRSDLLDRALVLYLPNIADTARRTETDIWGDFRRVHARVLGALLDAVSAALANFDGVRLERLPRMADFAQWAVAAETTLRFNAGDFMRAYTRNRTDANEIALDSSLVGSAVRSFMAGRNEWSGTANALLTELSRSVSDMTRNNPSFPKKANKLSGELRRIAPNLRKIGFIVEFSREAKSGQRIITLENA